MFYTQAARLESRVKYAQLQLLMAEHPEVEVPDYAAIQADIRNGPAVPADEPVEESNISFVFFFIFK